MAAMNANDDKAANRARSNLTRAMFASWVELPVQSLRRADLDLCHNALGAFRLQSNSRLLNRLASQRMHRAKLCRMARSDKGNCLLRRSETAEISMRCARHAGLCVLAAPRRIHVLIYKSGLKPMRCAGGMDSAQADPIRESCQPLSVATVDAM